MQEFLTGILSLCVLSVFLLLLLPEESEEEYMPLIKIAVGLWIIHSITSIFGHSLM